MHLNKMALCVSNLQGGYLMLFSHKLKSWELLEIPGRILAGMTTLSFSWLPELGICNLQNKFKIKYQAGGAGTVELFPRAICLHLCSLIKPFLYRSA